MKQIELMYIHISIQTLSSLFLEKFVLKKFRKNMKSY